MMDVAMKMTIVDGGEGGLPADEGRWCEVEWWDGQGGR